MARLREFLNKNPMARRVLVLVVVSAIAYFAAGRLLGGGRARPQARVQPQPPATVQVPSAATPAPAPVPQASTPSAVPPGPTGRPDPFIPLVRTPTGPPPSVALPPPPFPVPPGPLPAPGPGTPGAPSDEFGIAVTGIVGNSDSVAIIAASGRTFIVSVGEQIGELQVLRIDTRRRLVTFARAGKRFDVRMGGE